MSFIKANHSKASEGFKPMPAGKYEVLIDSGAFKYAGSGSPMINWKFAIRDDVEGQEQYKGRFQFSNLVFTEATEGVVQGFIKAIGVPDGMDFKEPQDLIEYAKGKAVLINVKIKMYQGEERNEVGFINESAIGGGKEDDPFMNMHSAGNIDPLDVNAGDDPFVNPTGPIEVSDDDLPF